MTDREVLDRVIAILATTASAESKVADVRSLVRKHMKKNPNPDGKRLGLIMEACAYEADVIEAQADVQTLSKVRREQIGFTVLRLRDLARGSWPMHYLMYTQRVEKSWERVQ